MTMLQAVKTYYNGGYPEAIDLSNGVTIRLRGDGTAHGDDGNEYGEICRGVGDAFVDPEDGGEYYDDYEFLGWMEMGEAQKAGLRTS